MSVQEQDPGEDIQARLAEWQQGDFTLTCVDLLFLDVPQNGDEPYEAVFDGSAEGCVVISQTCDIVREIGILPNVIVCPLVKIDQQRRAAIEKGQAPRYGLVDGVPDDIVADFSRAMSVSKRLLVDWERKRGCNNEQKCMGFALSLERFFGRFAFPDAFNESLRPLRRAIYSKHAKNSDLGKALRSIREIRVLPHANWDDEKSVPITFFILLEDNADREFEERDTIKNAIADKFDKIAWMAPFCSHENLLYLTTLSDMTAADYLNSYSLDLNTLSFARRFQEG
ncbi:hypothetical protein [Profundibacter sp.]